jgi:acetolactate synthase-1/2/3 large subunit
MIKLSDYVMQYISGLGVKFVFMLPGGGSMHLVDSLGRCRKLKYVANLHEQACAIAADAYSQYTGNIGVALVTTGPGGTNTITGVTSSWIESSPVLFISGQVKRGDLIGKSGLRQKGFQEADIVSLVKPITKYAVTIMNPDSIRYHLEKAVYLAKNGRPGPVWLDIPLDVQGAFIDEKRLRPFLEPKKHKDVKGLEPKINRLIRLINSSKRPVILVGNGVRLSGGVGEFKKLLVRCRIPVLTTWRTVDLLPEDHELFIGRPGAVGQRAANFAQQNADLIICIGARLDLGQTAFNHKNFALCAKKVIVDIDIREINKLTADIELKFNIDAKFFLERLNAKKNRIHADVSLWLKQCREWKKKYPVVLDKYARIKGRVNTYVLVNALSDLLKSDDVIVPGSSGTCSEITMQAFKIKNGQRFFNSPGLGSMGFGLPASIGACFASGRRRVVCIVGDGGLQHNIQELELLKRYRLPIKLFVLNNFAYASIRATQNKFFKGNLVGCDPSSGLTVPDTVKIARAYGLKAVKIGAQANLKSKLKKVFAYNGPVVCDVNIEPDLMTQPKAVSEVTPDGRIVSRPMEDLWPFLSRSEFNANMACSRKNR